MKKIFFEKENGELWKFGELNPDTGKYFLRYTNKEKTRQQWGSKEDIEKKRKYTKEVYSGKRKNKGKFFDLKEDGSPWKFGEYSNNLEKYFYGYKNKDKTLQNWGSKEKIEYLRKKRNGYRRNQTSKMTPLSQMTGKERKRGDICPDTKRIFWRYEVGGYETWLKPEKFKKYKKRKNDSERKYTKKDSARRSRRDLHRKKYKENKLYSLRCKLSRRLYSFCKRIGINKKSNTEDLIGANWETVKIHLESQFTEGMTWENAGKWHIDHKIPASRARTEEELYKLFHYTNLQPLWGPDNLSKGAKTQEEWEEFKRTRESLPDEDRTFL